MSAAFDGSDEPDGLLDLHGVRILDRLGGGALGDSYLARRHDGERHDRPELVVKVLHRHLVGHEEARGLFEHEARMLEALDHPAIPILSGRGEVDHRPYLAMPWVAGFDLATWLGTRGTETSERPVTTGGDGIEQSSRQEGAPEELGGLPEPELARLPLGAALDLGVQLAAALDHAHDRRDHAGSPLEIVHRDVSPDNVRIDPEGRVHLLDFGVAWSRWLPESCREGVRGTPRYMAPEQVRGETPDRRADVYALGALLFEALSGRRLRSGAVPALLVDAADRPAPPLLGLDPALPPEVCAVIDAALVLDVDGRTSSAAEIGESLRRAASYLGLEIPGDGRSLARAGSPRRPTSIS